MLFTVEYIFEKTHGIQKQEDFQTMLRAAGETETIQENNQDWLALDEGDPGFQLQTGKIALVIFFIYFHHHHLCF
jgi:hypothetical protein